MKNIAYQDVLDILPQGNDKEQLPPAVFRLRAEAAMALGGYREAILALQQCLQNFPHDAQAQAMLGALYMRVGEGDEIALSLCRQAVNTAPDDPVCLLALARVDLRLGRIEEAKQIIDEALRQQRLNPHARLLKARIWQLLGHTSAGQRVYTKA